jgi:excisionase family DNA binding protein
VTAPTPQASDALPLPRTRRKGVKSHRNYTVEEVARLLGIARGTVRRWTKKGLPFVTEQRPRLIRGDDLLDFLARLKAPKQRCQSHECYCFKCRAPREPALRMAEIICDRPTSGNLRALCSVCESWMHKRVSFAALDRLRAKLDVTVRQAGSSLKD